MNKYPIGFSAKVEEDNNGIAVCDESVKMPRKSVVEVYFPQRCASWSYYNDSFDLKVGDLVYVDGMLEGCRGRVTDVNYSFKIKLSEYKRVIGVADTDVKGDLNIIGTHIISFDRNVIPFSKVLTWFKTPESEEEYACGDDDTNSFSLEDLSGMGVSSAIAERGYNYYMQNKVAFIEVDGSQGHAIVQGRENYEVEFNYKNGEISNIKCSCFCSYSCKHEFAAMLQLNETLDEILKNYEASYNGYFSAVSKDVFMNTVMNKKVSGKISIGG